MASPATLNGMCPDRVPVISFTTILVGLGRAVRMLMRLSPQGVGQRAGLGGPDSSLAGE